MAVLQLLPILVGLAGASNPYIIGLCNSYSSPITIISRYEPTEYCTASPGESCAAYPSEPTDGIWLPDLPTDPDDRKEYWPTYRIKLTSHDGEINYNLWCEFDVPLPDGKELWGRAFGATEITTTGGSIAPAVGAPDIHNITDMDGNAPTYNVIVHANKRITMYQADAAADCPMDPANCTFDNSVVNQTVIASWVPTHFSDQDEQITITQGVTHEQQMSNSQQWSESTTAKISAGFKFKILGVEISPSVEVDHTSAYSIGQTFSSTISTSTTTAVQVTEPAGMVWQWQFKVTSNCGGSQISTAAIVHTKDSAHPPCCLPGFFSNPKDPHSECVKDKDGKVYDVCKRDNVVV